MLRVACTVARAAAWLLATVCCLWLVIWALEWYLIDPVYYGPIKWAEAHGFYIRYWNKDPGAVETKTFLVDTFLTWCAWSLFIPAFVAGLAVYAYWALPAGLPAVELRTQKAKLQRFWLWWCGGVNLAEAAFVVFLFGCCFTWTRYFIDSGYKYYDAVEEQINITERRPWLDLERWAITAGLVLLPFYLILFWPCAHNSWVNMALGLPWSHMIKYHRWAGHFTMWVMTVHGVLYYILWAFQPGVNFWNEFSSWQDSIPFFPGTIGWLFGCVLWVTSLYYLRRRLFEVFYKVHIVCFVGLVLFSCIHYSGSWLFLLPGMMPWLVDLAFRSAQAANVTTVVRGRVSDDQSIATVELAVDKGVRVCPAAEFFINIPSISLFQWHPFTVARKTGDTMAIHMKNYGNFTKSFMTNLVEGTPMPVRVTGPVGMAEERVMQHEMVVMITGGVGASPALLILQDLLARRAKGVEDVPKRVRMVWVTRHKSELTVLDEELLTAALHSDGWLSIELFYTGTHLQHATSIAPSAMISAKPASISSDSSVTEEPDTPDAKAQARGAAIQTPYSAMHFPWTSPLGFSLVRPVQPKATGLRQVVFAFVLGHIGAFFAYLLANTYYTEPATIKRFGNGTGSPFMYWKLGALLMLAVVVGSIGLPAFFIHPMSVWSYFRAVRRGDNAVQMMRPTSVVSHASTLVGGKVGIEEAGLLLDIVSGRPDVNGVLASAVEEAACLGITDCVGVFIGGPQPLVNAARQAVSVANKKRKKPAPSFATYIDTWEM